MKHAHCYILIRRWIWVVSAAAEFCLDRDQLFFDEEKQLEKKVDHSFYVEFYQESIRDVSETF